MGMKTSALECVITVAEEGSQSRAADKLLISQSAVNQQIRKVEKDIGIPLFRKEGRKLELTDAGKIYVTGAQTELGIYYQALAEIRQISNRQRKQVTLLYNNAFLPDMRKVLNRFMKNNRELSVSTVNANADIAKDYLIHGMADIAVIPTPRLSDPVLEFESLYTEELQLALPPHHPVVHEFRKHGVDFELLKDEYFILNQANSLIAEETDKLFQKIHFEPKVSSEIGDLNTIRNMVEHGRGIAFLPESMNQENRYEAFSLSPAIQYHVAIARRQNSVVTAPVQSLRETLREMLGR